MCKFAKVFVFFLYVKAFSFGKTNMNAFQPFIELVGTSKKLNVWDDVHKKLVAAHFVSCVDNYELHQIISDLKITYKGNRSTQQIADAIIACCKQREKKISSQLFLMFVLTKLN